MLKLISDRYCENSPTAQCVDDPVPVARIQCILPQNSLDGTLMNLNCFDYHCLYCKKLTHTYVE